MISVESIIAILAFVLNSVLLSGFIIPQVQKLKEVKDQLIKHKITYVTRSGMSFGEERKLDEALSADVEDFHKLFYMYRIRSNELSSLVRIFYAVIGIAALAIAFTRFGGRPIELNWQDGFLMATALSQFGVLMWAIRTYAVSPDRLEDVSYLVRQMDVNPHALVSAMGLNLSIDSGKELAGKVTRQDPLSINLSMKLRVFGFRFFCMVSGRDGKVYYLCFGPVTPKVPFYRLLFPPDKLWPSGEYNYVALGSFQFNMIQQEQDVDITLLIFLPFFKQEKLSPMVGHGRFEVRGQNSQGIVTASSLGMSHMSTERLLRDITYRGESTKIYELGYVGEDPNDAIGKAIMKFGREFRRTRKIREYSSLTGSEII